MMLLFPELIKTGQFLEIFILLLGWASKQLAKSHIAMNYRAIYFQMKTKILADFLIIDFQIIGVL